MNLLNRNFLVRTASAAVLAAIFVGAALLSPYTFAALLAVIMCGAMVELHRMARLTGAEPPLWYALAVALVALAGSACFALRLINLFDGTIIMAALAGVLVLSLPLLFVVELYRGKATPMANTGATLVSLVYIAFPLTLLVWLPGIFSTKFNGWYFLCYMFLVWANDVGAYIFGVTLGRHKLMERISPKKSWEGFIGGILLSVGTGAAIGAATGQSIAVLMGVGLVVALSGVAGDLVESMFKRSAGVKDSGTMMPGHGGFLDRFDSVLVSAPFIVLYAVIFKSLL